MVSSIPICAIEMAGMMKSTSVTCRDLIALGVRSMRVLRPAFNFISAVFVTLACIVPVFGQDVTAGIKFQVDGGSLKDTKVTVYRNGAEVKVYEPGKATMNQPLEFEHEYLIVFSKPGYITKKIAISTKSVPEDTRGDDLDFDFAVEIFNNYEGINTVVFNQPVAKYAYSKQEDAFTYDTDYTKSIRSALMTFEKQYEEAKKEAVVNPQAMAQAQAEEDARRAAQAASAEQERQRKAADAQAAEERRIAKESEAKAAELARQQEKLAEEQRKAVAEEEKRKAALAKSEEEKRQQQLKAEEDARRTALAKEEEEKRKVAAKAEEDARERATAAAAEEKRRLAEEMAAAEAREKAAAAEYEAERRAAAAKAEEDSRKAQQAKADEEARKKEEIRAADEERRRKEAIALEEHEKRRQVQLKEAEEQRRIEAQAKAEEERRVYQAEQARFEEERKAKAKAALEAEQRRKAEQAAVESAQDQRKKEALAKLEAEKKGLNGGDAWAPDSRTVDEYDEQGKKVYRVTVVKNGIKYIYHRVTHPWGGVFYFKDGAAMTKVAFDLETKP
jgi:hypothetical protein